MQKFSSPSVASFQAYSHAWWDSNGPYEILHRLTPLRLSYIKKIVHKKSAVLRGATLLDVGCGGGLLCEPLSRLGVDVTGLDVDEKAILCAKDHGKSQNLAIEYCVGAMENYSDFKGNQFDFLTVFEIVEHVEVMLPFLQSCQKRLKPGGRLFLSTMNRTWQSYVFGIFLAETLLGWVPKGMHTWSSFIKPSELIMELQNIGFVIEDIQGYSYNLWSDTWQFSKDLNVNYFLTARALG